MKTQFFDQYLRKSNLPSQSGTDVKTTNQQQVGLQKTLGFGSCIGMLVGIIIGSGIFVSPKGILLGSGSVGMTFIIWVLCGVFSLLGAMAHAELGVIFPASGGPYMFILEGFAPNRRKERSWWRELPPFLVSWQYNLVAKPASFALQGLAVAEYLHQISSGQSRGCAAEGQESSAQIRILAACVLILAAGINYFSVTWSSRIINALSSGKIISLAFIIISGLVILGKGKNEALHTGFEGTVYTPEGISLAFFSGLWGISGWSSLTQVVNELKNPKKDLLRSLVVSITLIVACYILTHVAYFAALTKEEFLSSNAVAVDFARKVGGEIAAIAMVLLVASSLFGSAVGVAFTNPRIIYAAGREGHLWDFVSYLHLDYMTPAVALLMYGGIALLFITQSSVLGLISLFGFIDGIVITLAMVALLIVRRTHQYKSEEVKFPIIVPVIVIAFNCFLVIMPLIHKPRVEYLFVLGILGAGVIANIIFIQLQFRIRKLDKLKVFGQKILNVVPPED